MIVNTQNQQNWIDYLNSFTSCSIGHSVEVRPAILGRPVWVTVPLAYIVESTIIKKRYKGVLNSVNASFKAYRRVLYADLKDVYAADILAWCLYKKGRYADAQEKSREALRINTKDAILLYHAGMIENALGNQGKATRLLRAALKLNPNFDLIQASKANAILAEIP